MTIDVMDHQIGDELHGQLVQSRVGVGGTTWITLPPAAAAYAANDVVGGLMSFPVEPGHMMLTSARLLLGIAAVPSGMVGFRLQVYKSQPTAIADNAGWTLPSTSRAAYLGYVDLGTPALLATGALSLVAGIDGINRHIIADDWRLFGYLVTLGAFTPAAGSEQYDVTLLGLMI